MTPRPRVLVVSGRTPTLDTDGRPAAGWDSRRAATLTALHAVADVAILDVSDATPLGPRPGRRLRSAVAAARAATGLPPARPYGITAGGRWTEAPEAGPPAVADHDLVWFDGALTAHRAEALLVEAERRGSRAVVDLDELVGPRLRDEAALHHAGRAPRDLARRRWLVSEAAAHDTWARTLSRRATCLVAAPEDVGHLPGDARHVPNVVVPPPEQPLRRSGGPPTVGFLATMTYGPNADAGRYLAREVLPHLRRAIPGVRVMLAGRGSEAIAPEVAGVERLGFVPDLSGFLAGLDVMLAPLRLASGTLVKVLTAWAHGVPVVGTPAALRGLAVTDGIEALVGTSPDELAGRCAEALDAPTRARLCEKGARLLAEAHTPRVLETVLRDIVAPGTAVQR